MNVLHKNEHLKCYNYDYREKPQIEVLKISSGQTKEITINRSEIVFFINGGVRFIFSDLPDLPVCEGTTGEFLFLPAGEKYDVTAISDSCVIIFRLNKAINLCENFMMEKLFEQESSADNPRSVRDELVTTLDIIPPLWHFLNGVSDCIEDGIRCRSFFETKIKELLMLMRMYYTKEQLYDFFYLILSADTAFSEYVRMKWDQYPSIEELAKSMHYTRRQFTTRFIKVFGMNPRRWMMEVRANKVFNDITSTRKQFKRIAADNMFYSDTYFTKFCKNMLGGTPSQVRAGEIILMQKKSKKREK